MLDHNKNFIQRLDLGDLSLTLFAVLKKKPLPSYWVYFKRNLMRLSLAEKKICHMLYDSLILKSVRYAALICG